MPVARITMPNRRLFAPALMIATLTLLAGLVVLFPQRADADGPHPPGPVKNLLLEATADTVAVHWEPPMYGGSPRRYIVHLKPQDGSKGKIRRPHMGKTSITFRNLESGATYRVSVRGKNMGGKGERVYAYITLPEADQ